MKRTIIKRILAGSIVMLLLAALFAGCGKTDEEPTAPTTAPEGTDTEKASNPFVLKEWLADDDNAMMFQYIDVSVYPDTWDRGVEATAHLEATEEEKKDILSFFRDTVFMPIDPVEDLTVDFAFAMNEPFMFFCFKGEVADNSLYIMQPKDSSGYYYYEATVAEHPELDFLREYIGEMRLGYAMGEGPHAAASETDGTSS